jgi:hypothetical protein
MFSNEFLKTTLRINSICSGQTYKLAFFFVHFFVLFIALSLGIYSALTQHQGNAITRWLSLRGREVYYCYNLSTCEKLNRKIP